MRHLLLTISLIGLLFCSSDLLADCNTIAADKPNASTITFALSVKQGQIWAENVIGGFCPSPVYKARRPDSSHDQEELLRRLQTAMKDLPKFYVYGLSNAGLKLDLKGDLKDSDTSKLSVASYPPSDWTLFLKQVQDWLDEYKAGYPGQPQTIVLTGQSGKLLSIMKSFIYPAGKLGGLATILKDSALYLPESITDGGRHTVSDALKGEITFSIIDPIGDWSNSNDYCFVLPGQNVCSAPGENSSVCQQAVAAAITCPEVLGSLSDLEGQLWDKSAIVDRLTDVFQRTGFSHTVDISTPDKHPVQIEIGGAAQLFFVRLVMSGKDLENINKALYMVLPDRQFQYIVRRENDPQKPWDEVNKPPANFVDICMAKLANMMNPTPGGGREDRCSDKDCPYLQNDQLAALPKQLDAVGFKFDSTTYGAITVCGSVEVPNSNYVVFLITPRLDVNTKKSGAPAQKPDTAPSQSTGPRLPPGTRGPGKVYTSRLPASPQVISNSVRSVSEGVNDEDTGSPTSSKVPAKGSNYVGFGLAYMPNQGVRFVGQYQRVLPNLQSISLEAGTESAALGSGSYHKDFLWFDQVHHRLQFDANGGTNYTHNRLFNGVQTNERRTGGSASLAMEWIRSDNGVHLDSTLTAGSSNVTLSNTISQSSQQLTYVDVGSNLSYYSSRPQLTQLHLQPTIRFGVTSSPNGEAFVSGSISADLLQYLTPAWMPDFRLEVTPKFQGATTGTPEYEVPSIGGAETVRGFRADASLARLATTVQSELWIPSTGSKRYHEGFLDFLSHKVWVAPFLDYGYSSQTVSGISGSLLGPGIGARILMGPALFKIDWGYGLYTGPSGLGGSKFSLDVKTTLPF